MSPRAIVTTLVLMTAWSTALDAHCEVPCGIYGDQHRFDQMLEDQETIAKAITNIHELCASAASQPLASNQLVRWVTTKEDHATRIQHTIAQYFMIQRIKSDDAAYQKKLAAAHAVMVTAMKCKQGAAPETAAQLHSAILDFQKIYEGKTK